MILYHFYTIETQVGPLTLTGEVECKIEYTDAFDWEIREIEVDKTFPFYKWLFDLIVNDWDFEEEVCDVIRDEMKKGPDPDYALENRREEEDGA